MPSNITSVTTYNLEPNPVPSSHLKVNRSIIESELRVNTLGDIASLFICALYNCQPDISGPHDFRKYDLDRFISYILRHMNLDEDVLFGALMFIQRTRFRDPRFTLNKNHAHKVFIAAYILSAKEFARNKGDTSVLLDDYVEWSVAAQGLFDGSRIQVMERATLRILAANENNGLRADTGFDGLLQKFRSIVVKDYEENWELSVYPQSVATTRPVFIIRLSDQEEYEW